MQFYRAGFVFYRVNGLGMGSNGPMGVLLPLYVWGGWIMEWTEFLTFASGPGVNTIVGVLLSEVAEKYLPGFAALASRWKRVVFFGLCLAVPLLASVLGVVTAGWPGTWVATYWPAVVAGGVAFGSGTLAHTRKL